MVVVVLTRTIAANVNNTVDLNAMLKVAEAHEYVHNTINSQNTANIDSTRLDSIFVIILVAHSYERFLITDYCRCLAHTRKHLFIFSSTIL